MKQQPRIMVRANNAEYSFWGNVEYPTNKDALKARNKTAREFKAKGWLTLCHTLPNQCRKYAGLGQPDGTIGNVYKLIVQENKKEPCNPCGSTGSISTASAGYIVCGYCNGAGKR